MIWYAEQNIQLRPAEGTSGESSICVPTSAGCFIGDKMKRIPLTQGQYTIVDDENYEWLSQYKWYAAWSPKTKSFYAKRCDWDRGKKEKYNISMAREILGLKKGDKRDAEHKNHNTLDNTISNIRICTRQENQFNRSPKGYSWHKKAQKYRSRIILNGKCISLGLYDTPKVAHEIYLEAKTKYHKIGRDLSAWSSPYIEHQEK